MADKQASQNRFFDPSTSSMRKGRDGGKKTGEKKRRMKIVATTSLPGVDRPNADCWNAARSCQLGEGCCCDCHCCHCCCDCYPRWKLSQLLVLGLSLGVWQKISNSKTWYSLQLDAWGLKPSACYLLLASFSDPFYLKLVTLYLLWCFHYKMYRNKCIFCTARHRSDHLGNRDIIFPIKCVLMQG